MKTHEKESVRGWIGVILLGLITVAIFGAMCFLTYKRITEPDVKPTAQWQHHSTVLLAPVGDNNTTYIASTTGTILVAGDKSSDEPQNTLFVDYRYAEKLPNGALRMGLVSALFNDVPKGFLSESTYIKSYKHTVTVDCCTVR